MNAVRAGDHVPPMPAGGPEDHREHLLRFFATRDPAVILDLFAHYDARAHEELLATGLPPSAAGRLVPAVLDELALPGAFPPETSIEGRIRRIAHRAAARERGQARRRTAAPTPERTSPPAASGTAFRRGGLPSGG